MRNFKKFLALVLATMMVLGGMVTVSAAEETAAAESVDYDAIYQASAEDLAALDILKGSIVNNEIDFALQNSVTRWQMALFVARIMTGETNDLYWSKVTDNTTPFDDVTNYFGAISYVSENGIVTGKGWIAGVGDNCFDPNGEIKVEEALTMAVRALGYKQLQYPQGFMTVAEDLGLTDGLEDLAIGTALTRGQMVQILKNMLYVKVDGAASFAEQNFGLEETVYVIVATELQYMVGTERVDRVDYEGMAANKQTKYVALAPLNADGTYDFTKIVHFTEEELGLAQGESELKMGYSYTVRSFNKFANVYDIVANATKTVKNYGDEGKAIVAGSKYNNIGYSDIVKVDGTTYKLVKAYSDLNNKSTWAGKTPELVVHSLYKGAVDVATSYYIYDDAFNILNPQVDAGGTYDIALMYNRWTNTYYAPVGNGYREATEEDFAKYAVSVTGTSAEQYGVTTTASELTTISFSELTLIDDDGDGAWDRGIYIPYSVGKYSTDSVKKAWQITKGENSGDTKKTVAYVNGQDVEAWATDKTGSWGTAPRALMQQSELFFMGEGRPNSGEYVVYYYNPYSRVFYVVENLGKPQTGVVQAVTQGSYAWDSANNGTGTYYWSGASVTIDGTTYKVGYRTYETKSQYANDKIYDLAQIDPNIALYGYSEVLYGALVGNTYNKLAYVVLAGRVIQAGNAGNNVGWIAFDYGTYDKNTANNLYTTYTYTGDIMGVDADGNILVAAYADKSGGQQIVEIGSINGYSYGLLVEDYAALQFQFSGIGVLGNNAMETMKKAVICDFFKTLAADLNIGNTGDEQRQLVYIVAGVSDDGVYEIYTDLDLYWNGAIGMSSYRQPTVINEYDNVRFYAGISDGKVSTDTDAAEESIIVLNKDSVILIAAKDGLWTATGIPTNATTGVADVIIKFSKATTYAISNDFIFIASKDYTANELFNGKLDADKNTNVYNYYMVVGNNTNNQYQKNTTASVATVNGQILYTYKDLYCLNTGEYVTLADLTAPLDGFGISEIYAHNAYKPLGAIYVERNGEIDLYDSLSVGTGSTTLNKYYYNADVYADLQELFSNASTAAYAGVYENGPVALRTSATKYSNSSYNIFAADGSSVVAENFKLTMDVISITYNNNGEVAIVAIGNNSDTSANVKTYDSSKGTVWAGIQLYYTSETGESFQGTVIRYYGQTKDAIDAGNAQTALNNAKTAAKAAADAAAAGYTDVAAVAQALANTKDIIDAQTDVTVINGIATGLAGEATANAPYVLLRAVAAAKAAAEQEAAAVKLIKDMTTTSFVAQNLLPANATANTTSVVIAKKGDNGYYANVASFDFTSTKTDEVDGFTFTASKERVNGVDLKITLDAKDDAGLPVAFFDTTAEYSITIVVSGTTYQFINGVLVG